MGSRSLNKYKRETISFKKNFTKLQYLHHRSQIKGLYVATEKGHLLIKDY